MSSKRLQPTTGACAALALCALSMIGCGDGSSTAATTKKSPPQLDSTPRVEAATVVERDLRIELSMPGSLNALESADLYAKLGGYLDEITVDIGDRVKADQLLARLAIPEMEPELAEGRAQVQQAVAEVERAGAQVDQARAKLATAEAELNRVRAMRREKEAQLELRESEYGRWKELIEVSPSIERRKLEEARYQMKAAQAAVGLVDAEVAASIAVIDEAQANVRRALADEVLARSRVPVVEAQLEGVRQVMAYAEILAPFDGVITHRFLHRGAFVMPASSNSSATPIVTVERVDRMRVEVAIPMDAAAKVDVGDPVVLHDLVALPGRSFEGVIARMSESLGERSRMMMAEVELDNPMDEGGGRLLRPGYYGDLTILLEAYPAAPSIPASALLREGGEPYVFVVDGDVARRRAVEPVYDDGTWVGVRSGLARGERVVTAGAGGIEADQRVIVETSEAPTEGDH